MMKTNQYKYKISQKIREMALNKAKIRIRKKKEVKNISEKGILMRKIKKSNYF